MAFFGFGKSKKAIPPQPKSNWPWSLSAGGYLRRSPTWEEIEKELHKLTEDPDSFLILEQRSPHNPKDYWFIQCAIASQGPNQGKYIVEIGFPDSKGPQLWERLFSNANHCAIYFSAAYHYKTMNFSGFQDTQF